MEFVRVARTKEIPAGTGRRFEINGREVAVFNVGGRFHAVDHRCAHQQGPLAEGDLDGCIVTCPWHGWTYDVTTGESPDDDGRIGRYDTKVVKGELLVAVPPGPETESAAATAALPAALRERGAVAAVFEGVEVVSHFGDVDREWRMAREGAALVPAGYRTAIAVTGGDRVDFLQGMLTNDVKALAAGAGCYAALLNQTGKVVSDVRVYADADRLLLDVVAWRAAALREALQRYIIADDVELSDAAEQPLLQIEGPLARAVASEALGLTELPEAPWSHAAAALEGQPIRVVSASEAAGTGVLVLGPPAVLPRLVHVAVEAGGIPVGLAALDRLRIEAGVAWAGLDMDESTLLMETGRDAAVSFTKGCYLGQEVVERIAARGHVNRRLSGVELEGDALPARGTALLADGRPVGYVTSAARSPLFARPIALAMIQIKHGTVGERLQRADDASSATVVALPFTPSGAEEERQ